MKRRARNQEPSEQPVPEVRNAFLPDCIRLKIDRLEPLKQIEPAIKESKKYRQIVASARIVGLVEPPAVAKMDTRPGYYYLVDGHLRIEALKDLGVQEVDCMVTPDADTYTYNKRVSRLSTVQDHKMIARAIELGVPEARIAEVLGLAVETIRKRSRLLNGICDEAAEILKHGQGPMVVFQLFRKLKPSRQIEAARIMRKSNDFSAGTARLLVASTDAHLLNADVRKSKKVVTAQSMAALECELQTLRIRNKEDEKQVSSDAIKLEMIQNYLAALLNRRPIFRWLASHQRAYVEGLAQIAGIRVRPVKPMAHAAPNGKVRPYR